MTRPVGAVVALLVLLVGCSSEPASDAPPETTTTTAAPSTTAPPTTPSTTTAPARSDREPDWTAEQQPVVDAYHAYWDAYFDAFTEPVDPDNAALVATTSESFFADISANLEASEVAGEAGRFPEGSIYESWVLEVNLIDGGTRAAVRSCMVNDGVVYDIQSGETVDDSVVTRLRDGLMIKQGEQWVVDQLVTQAEWLGVDGCAK